MRRACLLAVFVLASFAPAAPARAEHVQCGDTITESTTLDSDVVCPDDFNRTAVSIAADDVVFNLAGHAIRKAANPSVFSQGITHQDQLSGADIRNGTVEGFHVGVGLWGIDHTVRRLHIKARAYGIVTDVGGVSDGTASCERRFPGSYCIQRNVIETGVDGVGIAVATVDDAHVWGNTVRGPAHAGIIVAGDRSRTVLNKVETCYPYAVSPQGFGIQVWNYMTSAVIALNTVTPCPGEQLAIDVEARAAITAPWDCQVDCGQGRGAQVRRNVIRASSDAAGTYGHGLYVSDPDAIVAGNTADGNAGSGIVVASAGYVTEPVFGSTNTLVMHNSADDNHRFGIYAPNVRDGGGNRAAGNGTGDCFGIAC